MDFDDKSKDAGVVPLFDEQSRNSHYTENQMAAHAKQSMTDAQREQEKRQQLIERLNQSRFYYKNQQRKDKSDLFVVLTYGLVGGFVAGLLYVLFQKRRKENVNRK